MVPFFLESALRSLLRAQALRNATEDIDKIAPNVRVNGARGQVRGKCEIRTTAFLFACGLRKFRV